MILLFLILKYILQVLCVMANGNETESIHDLIFIKTEISLSEHEERLPPLPLPPLKQTLQKYLLSVKPFLTEKELFSTTHVVNEFESGVGQQLQIILEKRAKQKKNWMEEWWQKYAYMSTREPLIPTSNMASNHPLNMDYWPPIDANAMKYGAISIWIVAEFYKNIRRGLLRSHYSIRGEKLSMSQFCSYFNVCRLPGEGLDKLTSHFKLENDGSCPNHIVIFCNGHIWTMNPWDATGEQLKVYELEDQLKFIKEKSHAMPKGPEIAALTLSDRDTWNRNREHLISISERNRENLELIESAMFHVVLEDSRPSSLDEAYSLSLCGCSGNRWADKNYSIIIFDNGYVGSNSEHSPADAMVSVTIGYYALNLIMNEIGDVWWKEEGISRRSVYPSVFTFDVNASIYAYIHSVKKTSFELQKQIDARYYMFECFGTRLLRSQKVHSDTFVQCAIQLAYYTIHKKLAPTYETATTRKFYHARTETVRSCTVEMADWLKTMKSPSATETEKKSRLIEAMKIHLINMRACQNGQGIDRHLLGLYVAAIENGFSMPQFFNDPAFSKSGGAGKYVLSTSTVGTSHVVGGVVPMVKDGYAVMYSFLPERINFTVTSYKHFGTCSEEFIKTLQISLVQLRDVLCYPASNL